MNSINVVREGKINFVIHSIQNCVARSDHVKTSRVRQAQKWKIDLRDL